MANPRIGLQIYTIRDEIARDPEAALAAVAGMGYSVVEVGGAGSMEPGRMERIIASAGLQVSGVMTALPALEDPAGLQAEIEYARSLGARYIVIAWLAPEDRQNPPLAHRLNAVGRAVRDAGLRLAYHNHDFEFERDASGTPLLDRLLASTDPDGVSFELDVYWAAYAGADPLEYLERYRDRISLVHLKDLAPDRSFADVGEGTLDMPEILRRAAHVDFMLTENDRPAGPSLESARRSLENLRSMGAA